MLTEVQPTFFNIVVNGKIAYTNIPSIALAESTVFHLSPADRSNAQIVPVTSSGQHVLFG